MKIYTIGFTQKSAEQFFNLLQKNGIERLIDIRVHPDGQLAGFAKKEDLGYFLRELLHCDYVHLTDLAPTVEIMKAYRSSKDWLRYKISYQELLNQRGIPDTLDRSIFEEKTCCLLCSEPAPDHCHRQLAAERLATVWQSVEIIHL